MVSILLKGYVILFLIIAVMVTAGCADTVPAASTPSTLGVTPTAVKPPGPPIATTGWLAAATVQPGSAKSPPAVFTGEYHWAEYRENDTVTMPPNPRYQWEYSLRVEKSTGEYGGGPAIHYRITRISDYPEWVGATLTRVKDGWVVVEDTYYEPLTNRFLGEARREMVKGVVNPDAGSYAYYTDHCREERPCGEMGFEPFAELNITLTDEGKESVTVPAGSYRDARKFTGGFWDGTPITFWVEPGVPVPVQYQFPNKYMDGESPFQSYELKGWG
jgi:hypothetical protein